MIKDKACLPPVKQNNPFKDRINATSREYENGEVALPGVLLSFAPPPKDEPCSFIRKK